MYKISTLKISESQYINYLAVEIAEKLISTPQQSDIDLIEKKLKLFKRQLVAKK